MESITPPGEDTPPASEEVEKSGNPESGASAPNLENTSSLEGLQTVEQRRVLETVARLRKCGLESVLFLPQIVVCGDQSAGKSSVLEALTEIPFPRQDNLCTRFATEIILRHATVDSLTVRVIPDQNRFSNEQETIKAFNESITDFGDLPVLMDKVMLLMGIDKTSNSKLNARAFARDVLSIEIEGPSRPHLMLVDLPGLVLSETKGVTQADIDLVDEITERYISQPRTICLPVISAGSDYATQGILTKVRKVDPNGERTLGIITKPDRIEDNSGSEQSFLGLARNEDVYFKLGWHVLKNRKFEEQSFTFLERNAAETAWFRKSKFSSLPKGTTGIDALRDRLSKLLFDHVKKELPKLREDVDEALHDAKSQLATMGKRRVTPEECRQYMIQLSLDCYDVCKAAVNGHYEGDYFQCESDEPFSLSSNSIRRRLRACVQFMNSEFSNALRMKGHKYQFDGTMEGEDEASDGEGTGDEDKEEVDASLVSDPGSKRTEEVKDVELMAYRRKQIPGDPITISRSKAIKWVGRAIAKSRGRELPGNFNPLLIGELFWEQSCNWHSLAENHAEKVQDICTSFLQTLLEERCPKDVFDRIWSSQLLDEFKGRNEAAGNELDLIMEDVKSYPINYNHYYTDVMIKKRQEREQEALRECIKGATTVVPVRGHNDLYTNAEKVDVEAAAQKFFKRIEPDMDKLSCQEALDCLFAIYKVSHKTFIANITTQVIERHIVRGLENIFSPISVAKLADVDVAAVASEPASAKQHREFLDDRIKKLTEGHQILRKVIGGSKL
ncbi:hypothetical protein MMC30_008041 [Trapelia coarctata]|nr:hypothetical protein [Trapelia coarctata]